MNPTVSNPSTAQARVLVDELIRHGITDVVLCPGSRSAPLALALAAAERSGRLALHVRIDERAAGFTALGLALGSRRPVPVVVTSGTAVANLHPAMVEAAHSGVPILALTANRPPELRGTGANQTIDQVGLFGPHARAVVELGAAGDPESEHRHWRSAIGRAILTATAAADPGPVQVDIAFREPLVPGEGDEDFTLGGDAPGYDDDEVGGGPEACRLPEGRADGRPWVQRAGAGVDSAPADSAVAVDLTRPTLVVSGVGAAPVSGLVAVPTVAEPGAPVPLHPVHPLAIPALRPEQVVVTGRPTLHRAVTRLLADPDVDLVILDAGPRSPNPTGSAAELADSVLTGWGVDPEWTETTARADARARAAVDRLLDRHLETGAPTGLHVARAVARGVRAGDNLVVGASNAVRDLSFVGPLDPDVAMFANRGASGIDGTVSTAIGVALSAPGRTVALLGDLTFLHDVSGLLLGPRERHPDDLTIVVADDDGGGIFSLLEQGDPRLAADFERVFGTPHGADLGALCAGAGVPFTDIDPAGLEALLAQPAFPNGHRDVVPEGLRVVRVATDRQGLRDLHAALRSEAVADG
ncbi:2-succinyl-5-enolpyruvyl-6-hydroxy-3-cyclohexene-1-carboxylic-acid synthase [Dietzia maris]|uniref:2-succinyl-5-enolpyruvyl-6-hydroxy-3- cyclohexene-1-carboxylic-acid synthase n=1 Tax=Dietzia TaxID=37914 RepID=UPI0022B340EA|nr:MULTISPECIES: 2-succinyl-5-enolpyruvyl-6-hydroxy-3-cyclohexene-1-carboxylic-acid synthase [Dietzia]MCZ4539401.1 2-succinyl-5-enolpyruvyl-6-hydroxy-3-cyclohexene-1-carboxylic-acid synthase [Dietzia maris]MDV3354625.1 2-succinyl-5-enolpyruvyl-6-hydroxy-3-cyclohexene-1-carboxylic-acid synthase [Dietzia sp. IN118]